MGRDKKRPTKSKKPPSTIPAVKAKRKRKKQNEIGGTQYFYIHLDWAEEFPHLNPIDACVDICESEAPEPLADDEMETSSCDSEELEQLLADSGLAATICVQNMRREQRKKEHKKWKKTRQKEAQLEILKKKLERERTKHLRRHENLERKRRKQQMSQQRDEQIKKIQANMEKTERKFQQKTKNIQIRMRGAKKYDLHLDYNDYDYNDYEEEEEEDDYVPNEYLWQEHNEEEVWEEEHRPKRNANQLKGLIAERLNQTCFPAKEEVEEENFEEEYFDEEELQLALALSQQEMEKIDMQLEKVLALSQQEMEWDEDEENLRLALALSQEDAELRNLLKLSEQELLNQNETGLHDPFSEINRLIDARLNEPCRNEVEDIQPQFAVDESRVESDEMLAMRLHQELNEAPQPKPFPTEHQPKPFPAKQPKPFPTKQQKSFPANHPEAQAPSAKTAPTDDPLTALSEFPAIFQPVQNTPPPPSVFQNPKRGWEVRNVNPVQSAPAKRTKRNKKQRKKNYKNQEVQHGNVRIVRSKKDPWGKKKKQRKQQVVQTEEEQLRLAMEASMALHQPPASEEPVFWSCSVCTFNNRPELPKCEMCDTPNNPWQQT